MKDLNGSEILGYHIFRTEKTNSGTLRVFILILVILILFSCSCSNKIVLASQDRDLSSAYTHSGKYETLNRLGKKRDAVRKYNLKCHIPSNRKK